VKKREEERMHAEDRKQLDRLNRVTGQKLKKLPWAGLNQLERNIAEAQLDIYHRHLYTGADELMGPRNDPPDLGESVRMRPKKEEV
jgi:hypothetical protein